MFQSSVFAAENYFLRRVQKGFPPQTPPFQKASKLIPQIATKPYSTRMVFFSVVLTLNRVEGVPKTEI
jgi:hypothetical protein